MRTKWVSWPSYPKFGYTMILWTRRTPSQATGSLDAVFLRAGYVFSDPLDRLEGSDPEDGARVGFGIRFGALDMSIAKSLYVSPVTGRTDPVQVTFSIGF